MSANEVISVGSLFFENEIKCERLAEIDGWFKDYNENHPHKGRKMRSPAEFRKIFSN